MAKKKKSVIKDVVETVESWVGMGPKATNKAKKKAVKKKAAAPKTAKKGAAAKKAVKKKK